MSEFQPSLGTLTVIEMNEDDTALRVTFEHFGGERDGRAFTVEFDPDALAEFLLELSRQQFAWSMRQQGARDV